ncbi:MAG: hypothetical protein Q4B14_03500, partial [Clostridia bacterium]|nr:hypothetical protein [Clostridia bacterium]
NHSNIGKIYCFGSSALMSSLIKPVSDVAKKVNIPVSDKEFHCKGAFNSAHIGHPDDVDLKNAENFAKYIFDLENNAKQ